MSERPLYTLYKNLKAQNYDVPDDYNKFESALTRDGKGGADNRHAIYENLKAQNFDVPNTYERFYSALFEPRSKTSSRAKGGSVPMTAADRARFSAGAAAISASANNAVRQAKRNIQSKLGQANKFNGGRVAPHLKNPLQNQNVQKNEFNYNSTTGKTGTYTTTDGVEFDNEYDATQYQNQLDKQGQQYINAVNTGEIPSVFDVRDKNGNYDLQENINKNGTYLTEEGARNQFDKKLADAYARKKEIEAAIAEDHRLHGNPLLSYGASIGASNGRTAEQSDYSNKLATSLALVKQQIGALEAVKQYPTSSWGEDALKALDNTAFTAKTWDFGLTDFATMGQMERIKTKMDNNLPLSGSDKMLLKSKLGADAAAALEDEKMGNIYRWTKIAGQSLPFMADFFLTGGYGGITKVISRGALKFAAKRGMGKVSAAILKNTGIVAGDVIGSYAMAGTEQALKTGADIMQRHLGSLYQDEKGDYKFGTFDENGNLLHEGGESMGTALYKGLTSAMVENYTEKLFGHNYGIKKGAVNFMEKHGMNASAEFFKNIGKSGWYTNSKKWMEKFGINGFGEEVMEEEIGIPLHALLDGDNKFSDLLDTKQQLDIIGGMALSVGSMYAMGAGSRPVKGVYNRAQYYRFRNKVNVADSDAQNLIGDKWEDIKDKIDNTTNKQMGGVLADILRQRDTMSKDQINAAINYGINLMKMRGYNVAKTAEMNAREITNEPTTPEEQHQEDIDNAYSEGHDADDADKHDIQLEHEDQMKTLAGLLNISEQQLSAMNDDELQSLTGQNDKLDQAIYDYQLSSARYQGVTDDAQDKIDMAANQAAQRVDMYTDKSRGSVRNATVKASGGAEDYGVYIISGNIATNEDGSINVADSDDMILFYDPTTNSVEHADALRFAELGDEVPADDVKAQAVADAKEKAIKEVASIVDGTIDVGSQFKVTGADGLEHTYEILADYGDGTAAISIDGNVVENPYSLEDLQHLKDLEDQKRLEAAKAQREQMEMERAEQTQETEQPEEIQPSLDFNQILNDDGNVVLVDVLDKDGNTKYPDSRLFLIRDTGAKAKVVELKSDGTFVPHAVSKKNVATISSMSLDEYKQAMAETSMIEENSGAIEGDRGGIEVNDELPPVPDNVTINGDGTYSVDGAVQGGENTTAPAEQTEQTPAMTLEDGTIVPMLEDGNPDFSKLTADQTAELYDSQFGEDADSVISGWVSDAKKALDKANNMTVKGKNFVEQKAAKEAKEKAIADAQATYDSAVAIRDAYNERQLAKVEDTAEGRKELIEKARRKFARLKSAVKDDAEAVSQLYKDVVGSLLHRLYDGTGIDVTDTIPLTAEEYVASNLGAHSLNYEGTETSKGVKQETGLSREDFAKTQLLAADGKGTTIDDLVHSLWENRPSNLESLDTQDIRNALIGVLTSGFKASEARNYIENLRIAQAENILEEQKKAADNAAFAEEQKANQEEEEKKSEENEKINEQTNENINTPELSHEQQKAMEDGEKLGFPAFDKEGEPINEYVIELANWAKEQGLEIDPTSKSNSYADLFLMCKDGFGVSTLVPDEGENINQVVYFPDNVQDFDQLWKLQEEFNAGRDLKHSSNIDSEITEGATFYDADTAREFKEFVDKKVEEQNKVFGEQRPEEDLPFSAKENGKQQTTAERAADVEKNKVDDMKVVDNIVGQKTRKTFERLAKMMGANIQWQYSDKLGNGWIQETTDSDGNVHRTIFITLDSSITEGAQFIFGHEMTHQIKRLNPASYNELTQLVLDTYGSDAFDKAIDETMKRYSDAGFSGRARDYYAEEVVADAVGEMIRDLNLAHTLAMKMSHPLLAAIHEILQKIKLAFFGTEYSDVTKNIIRSIEQAYVKTANGEVTNSETGEDVSFSLRQKPEPKKKGIGYKVFVLKDGKLYPPMVANPDGAATPVGVWLDADAAPIAGESKTGRPQVKQGGKGTQGGSGKLAYRPGWHLGVVPYAIQFNRKDADGNKTLFPKNFVFAEVEYAADVDYQEEARQEGINPSGKYQHSLAGLKHLPTDGYYMYRTNPNPETDPWVITGAMKVNRILTRAEQAELVKNAGREPQQIQDGDIVTDDVVNSINQEIAAAPKFSLKVYHGSGADFTEFDFDHMGEGAGSQAFGWGGYVTSSEKIARGYTSLAAQSNGLKREELKSNISRAKERLPFMREGEYKTELENEIKQWQKELANLDESKNLYEVEIPENNGSNYLDWDAPITDELIDKVVKALPSLRSYDIEYFKKDRTFDNFYKTISMRSVKDDASFNDDKAASKLLASLGYTGIKYKAGRNFGGAKEGDTNYVIFKPEDMKITEHTKFSLKDNQGNPLNQDGTLKLDKIKSVDELTDGDFLHPTRNVELPSLPKKIADAIGTEGKPVVIKKNIFERNYIRHKDVTPELSKVIFKSALYNPDLYGQNQKKTRPYNWLLINTKDEKGNNRTVLLEVNPNKDNVEIVHWHFVDERGLQKIKKQADREDGQLLILPSNKEEVGALSDPTVNLSAAKIDNSSETAKENGEKFSLKDEKIKSVAEKFGVNEDDVAMYANAVERGSTAEAARARANIKRYLLQANEDKISSFKDSIKYIKPINEALKENFGDLDAMIEERRKQVEAQRNAMEAARKRAQEEEEKRQKHLDELSLIPTDELDKRYMDAIDNNDESTAREMLDESARRNGYGDVDSDYQGQGAWTAPSNPQYESDEARRADIENSPDVNLETRQHRWNASRGNSGENNANGESSFALSRSRAAIATYRRELAYREARIEAIRNRLGMQSDGEMSLSTLVRYYKGSDRGRNAETDRLFDKALDIVKRLGVEFNVYEGADIRNPKREGVSSTDRRIELFLEGMARTELRDNDFTHTILHEMLHQATVGSINLVKNGKAEGFLTPKQIEGVNEILEIYDKVKDDKERFKENTYGLTDAYELTAQMADLRQRKAMGLTIWDKVVNAAHEFARKGDRSILQRLKDAWKKLFEVSDKDKMDKAINDIMDDFKEKIDDISMNNIEETDFGLNGNTRFSLRYDQFEHDLNQWKKDNNLPKDAQRPTIPQRNAGESAVDFLRRVDEYRKQMALWKTAPTYEQHLLSDDTALGEFNRELQRGSVLKRIAFQDSMLAIRKAQEAIMKEVGVDRLNMAEDAYTAENRSHGKGKNEFEEYNNEFLQPLRKAYHQMKKVLGDSYDNVRVYMMAKHGLERDAQMAFKKSLEADYEDVNQRSAAYKAYKNDLDRVSNDADLEFGRVDFTTWRQKDNALRGKYSPSYMDYRYDDNGIAYDYSGLSSLFDGSDFEEAAHRLVRDVENKHLAEVQALWNATNAATKKILRDGFKAGMMSKDTYQYVRDMYSHYIPLRGWDGTTADQVWDYIGGGKGAFNQTLKTAHGRTSIADDPIAYIENMAESGILLNNKNWVKQHLMLLAQNHPTSLLTLSKAWYVKSTDVNGNEEWIPATPQITSQMNSNQVKAAIDAFEQKMEQLAQTGDATQQRDGLNIAYPQTHSEEREHEVRVMKDGEEYVIYVNGDPQLAQAMNNTRAHRVREIQSGKLDRAAAWLGRKMAAAYTSLSPLFIPSNYFRDLTMTLASTAIREDGRYNYLLRKNLATSWNLGFMLRDYQNGKLREKVNNGNATAKEQMFYDFMMNGGETGFVSSLDVEDLKKKFKNDLKDLDRWKANPVKVGHTIMDGIEFLNRAIEDSNRFAVYMTSIQYGRSIDEAVNDAKDVTLNFNRKGTGEYGWQMIRNLYLFINPAVQSLQTLGALAKHHPFKFTAVTAAWLASGVLVPIVNAALMSLLGGDDDKDKYWQFSKWDRRNNAIMWIPFTNEYVKIPLAQEFRAFYGIGDMIASKMMGGELAEETWSQYAEDLLGQVVDMLPLDPTGYDGNIAVSLMPNPIRPVFELAFNVDFTGKPLFKETEYNKYDPNFTKAYVGTPDWLVRVSKMVNSIGNDYPDVQQNAIDAFGDPRYNLNNPAVVDHVLSSYLGGAYTMGSQVLGVLTKSLNDPKEIKMADIPLVSKFVSNPDDRPVTKKQGDEFWNMKENHDRAANTLSKLKKQAKVDGDYSMLERFYGSEEYKQYKQEDVKVKKYEEDKKKERAEESGEEYRPHKLNAEDIYKAHATPKDDFEDLKLKQLYTKLNGFKTSYDLLVDTAPSQSDGYYNTNKVAIDAIDEISIDKQQISELKKGFLDDGKDAYNAEDMKRIRELRKRILSVLEPANKVVVANQKAKAENK